ncbi:hypothetical protein SNK19_22985 [Ralstonia pseudosolanacearum]|uniref:hypothetical protein n=1 Tax=Ralstonia pseudosolanacearum TaxID=1310165 RepID=UPI003CEF5374
MRIKLLRIHIPLLHLLSFVVVAAFCALGFDSHVNPIVCVVGGAAAMLIGLIFAIAELFRRKKGLSLFRISWGFFCCCQWPCSPSL